MAIIKAINSRASIGKAINYITKGEKTDKELTYGKDCNPNTSIEEMKATKELYGKTGGREYIHLVQSFDPLDNITFETAHKVGQDFINKCEKYKGHEVLMSTHMDKGHIHNHFIINSVNFENGSKLVTSSKELQNIKNINDEVCRGYNLSIPKENNTVTAYSKDKYKALEKGFNGEGNSYILNTAEDVIKVLETAISRQDFIEKMNKQGYEVNWKDTRKYVTFENSEGQKVRNSNLEKTLKDNSFSKVNMEHKFRENELNKNVNLNNKSIKEQSSKVNDVNSSKIKGNDIVKVIENTVKQIENTHQDTIGKREQVKQSDLDNQNQKERTRER